MSSTDIQWEVGCINLKVALVTDLNYQYQNSSFMSGKNSEYEEQSKYIQHRTNAVGKTTENAGGLGRN